MIADLDRDRAREACRTVGWDEARIARTAFTDDGARAIAGGAMSKSSWKPPAIPRPASGMPAPRSRPASTSSWSMSRPTCWPGRCSPRKRAQGRRGLFAGLWRPAGADRRDGGLGARAGFRVVAAGKGTKYLPAYHDVTPDDVWGHYGLTAGARRKSAGMNPQMFNSFLDGTKSAIEMAAIANATGLDVPHDGLLFPPCGVDDLPHVLRPREAGGVLERPAWSRWSRRWSATAGRCSATCAGASMWCSRRRTTTPRTVSGNTACKTDASGRYAAMYKPYHLIGLELDISVLSAALRGEPTGQPHGLARRRRRRRQARSARRRNARRRRRLYGLGQADAGGGEALPQARCRSGSRIE